MAPLREFARQLRAEARGVVPDLDPRDGGIDASILFLMEKPGPMTDDSTQAARAGSGFISRDNDDPSAEATWRFMAKAQIARRQTILWNTVPWWNGTRRVSRDELAAGVGRLTRLIYVLPRLRVVVGVGNKAARAEKLFTDRGLTLLRSANPSRINRASRPAIWAAIPDQWAQALAHLQR